MGYDSGFFRFEGRISRQDYWLKYVLAVGLIDVVAAIADVLLHAGGIVNGVAVIVTLVPTIAGAAKRCHDRDRSGWFQLIALVPIIGGIWLMVELGFLRGTPGTNRFGPDPMTGRGF
jgi:uncharacterized membrane protein YhaH (DUF805 family)